MMAKRNRIVYLCSLMLLHCGLVKGGQQEDLDKLQAEFGEWRMKRNPEFATSVGIYKFNDKLSNASWTNFLSEKTKAQEFLDRLTAITYTSLEPKGRDDYDILKDTLVTFIDGYRWSGYGNMNPINFLEGLQTNIKYFPSIVPFNTQGDFENYVVRLSKTSEQIDFYTERLQKAVALNHTYYNVSMIPVPSQITNILKTDVVDFAYYSPLNEILQNNTYIASDVKEKMRQNARDSVASIMNSLRIMRDYITNVYIPHSRPGVGANTLENGDEYYKACLRWHLTMNVTPEYVHKKGLEEVERISTNMKKAMRRLGHEGSVKQFFGNLRNNSKFFFNTSEEVLMEYKNIIFNRINPKLTTLFKNLPELPIEVKASPTDGPGGYYVQGPEDGSRPGIFYANVFRPKEMLKLDFMALAIHEANPGHHFQISIQSTSKIPTFRKSMDGALFSPPFEFPFFTAYVEGWALYAEALGEEMKLYKDDYELMGRYGSEIFRACRLVVDTGLNYFGWSREKAIEYMLNYTAYSESAITIEVNRYITWPGQACSYKIGEIKIRELRSKAEGELGDSFDIKEFHDTILKNGPVSMSVLERIVDQWIVDVKTSGPVGTVCAGNSLKMTISNLVLSFIIFFVIRNIKIR